MGAFLQALSALAPVAPAMSDARDLRTQREQEEAQFGQETELRKAQLTAQQFAAQAEQQRIRAGSQPMFKEGSQPEFNPLKGTYTQPAWNADKGAYEDVAVPGVSPEETAKYKLDSFKKNRTAASALMPDATPDQLDYLAYILSEMKPPATRAGMAETDYQKQSIALRQAQESLREAEFQASRDPNNPVLKTKVAQANAMLERAQAQLITAYAGAQGTTPSGTPLPGALTDADGNPIGSHFQSNVRPTGTEIGRADLSTSALDQMDTMKDILTKRSDLFGPAAGRATNFTQWVGSQDPDAQQFSAAARTAADHLAGVFGGRSQAALQAIYDTIGRNQTNPAAAIAALNQMEKAAKIIQKRGTRKTVGGVPQNTPFDDGGSNTVKLKAGGKSYNIPRDQVAAFRKDHPDATQ